ncbi:hypothetical protein BHE74_00039975 [Ensete ventricosum]|nr:hypothetical protein BHE74_00039975 [Ensete ventricosum]
MKRQPALGGGIYPPWFLRSLPLPFSLLPSLLSLLLFVVSNVDFANVFGLHPFFLPPTVFRVGRMSSASSHSKSRSVEILAHRSRALSHPSRDSRSTGIISSFGGRASSDYGTADALAAMRSYFDVDSTMTTHRLDDPSTIWWLSYGSVMEMFNLGKMKSGGGVGSGSTIPSAANAPATVDVGAPMVEKRPSTGEGASLRKHPRRTASEQPANASGSTARTPAEKGKGVVELEEAPEWGYTIRELCEVEDRAGSDKYFASIMMRRKCVDSEDPLVSSNRILEARVLDSSLDEVRNDRARLEGEVLSLIEASTFLEVELKGEGSKAVAAYKAYRRFELGLGKMGRVSYEFGYRVALERL